MDEFEYLANIQLLTQPHSPENRLKLLLENTREFFNLDICSILFLADGGRDFHIINCGDRDEFIQEYREKYLCLDQHHDFPDGRIVVFKPGGRGITGADQEFSEFCRQKMCIRAVAGADFRPHQNLEVRLRLTRSHEQREFNDNDIRLLEKLIEPIRNTIDIAIKEKHQTIFNMCSEKLLTRFRIGVLLLSRNLEILDKSSLADDILERTRAYHSNKKKLVGRSRDYHEQLEQFAMELEADDSAVHYRTLTIKTPDKTEQYTLVMATSASWPYPVVPGTNLVVFIFSSVEDSMDPIAMLRQWRISPAEQKVLAAIVRFDNVKKVALELKISPNTAKAQLKSAYRKLGIESKTMLLKRLNMVRNIEALLS